MKKYFLLAVFSLMVGICSAYDFSAVSPSGHTLYYNIDGSNVKVTSEIVVDLGTDAYETLPTGDLGIPETVTHDGVTYTVATIGDCAFLNCRGLTSVTIPATVTTIESGALAGCSGIKNLVVPATVTTIEENAFRYVRHIEYNGPATDNSNWNALSLNGVVDGNFAYPDENKTRLNACLDTDDGTVTIPASVKVIAGYAFVELSSLISIDVPNSVDSIGTGAFRGCENLVSATLPTHISLINGYLFCDCKSLKSFVVPDSVKNIRSGAFLNCASLSEVTIGYAVEKIYGEAFRNCTNLRQIHALAPVASELANGDPFSNVLKEDVVVYVPGGSMDSYKENWTCFSNFKEEWNPRYNVFAYTHEGQTLYYRLKTETRDDVSVTYAICSYPVLTPIDVETVWEGYAKPVGDVVIPSTLEHNGQHFPVADVGRCAFAYCDEITNISVPEGVFRLGQATFYHCTRLQSVTLPSTIREMDTYVFQDDSALVTVNIPEGVTSIPYRTFYNCVSLPSVNIPEGVTTIGKGAFHGCTSLHEVKLPQSVTRIEDSAFRTCTRLASITMPDHLDYMGELCFADDSTLTAITIPAGISTIKQWSFYKCNRLTSIVIPEGVSTIENSAFAYCDRLQSVVLPESLESIGTWVFFDSKVLTDITVVSTTPPTTQNNTFSTYDATLYVPVGTAEAYRQHEVWGKFSNIVEGTPTSIDASRTKDIKIYARGGRIIVEGADSECVQVFNMKGQQIPATESLSAGIYMVKVGNRPTRKIVVSK